MRIVKEDDDEMVLQCMYALHHCLLNRSTRLLVMAQQGKLIKLNLNPIEFVSNILDLLYDRNVELRKMCDLCLDIISVRLVYRYRHLIDVGN